MKALSDAVNEVDHLILLAERHNDQARHGDYMGKPRLQNYLEMRAALHKHRQALVAIYVSLTGTDPWKDIPL